MTVDFGKTWWGSQFLHSLSNIDYSNRLPRGRSYARNGHVKEIKINENTIKAKVSGSRYIPYKVTITVPKFSTVEKEKLMAAINADPLLLSLLLNRELPPKLNRIAENKKIKIFPKTWKDFGMKCSCPDWAVPCKHLASVIYMLSAEIDRNPFLLFQLHGLNILKELEKTGLKGREELEAPEIGKILKTKAVKGEKEKSLRQAETFDLSVIQPMRETLFSLLDENPIFFKRAFIPVLRKNYKAAARQIIRILAEEKEELSAREYEKPDDAKIILHNEAFYLDTILFAGDDEKHFPVNRNGIEKLIHFVNGIPLKYAQRLSAPLRSLYRAYHFSLKIIETGSFVPQLLKLSNGSYIVRWIPATGVKEIENLISILESIIPDGFIQIMIASNKPKYLDSREQVNTLVSIFIGYFLKSKASLPSTKDVDSKIENLFFSGEPQTYNKPGESEIPGSIYQWLSRFYISNQDFVPLIKIDDDKDKNVFSVELLVENQKKSLQKPIRLHNFLSYKKYASGKTGVLQSLASLSRDFPDIGSLVSLMGKEKLFYDSDSFVEILLKILPVVKLLGINILLPNSLKTLVRPQTSLMLKQNNNTASEKHYLNLSEILDFEWQVAIGDQTVSLSEFNRLIKGVSGVVNIKGQYVLIDRSEIQTLLNNLEKEERLTPSELLKVALTEDYKEAKISISAKARETIRRLLNVEQLSLPQGLHGTLRPYQERGFQWMYNNATVGFGSIIADDMGLGKTIQVITLLLQLKHENRFEKQKALIIVPTTILTNWQKEIERFGPQLSMYIYHGPARKFPTNQYDLVITSYGILRSDSLKFQKTKWAAVIIDEAQNIKNAATEQTKAVKKLKAPVKIAMSGTPVENRLSEYWSIFDFVNKGYLGSAKYFKKEFASPIELDNNKKQLDTFRKITSPFILRRLKTDKSIISDLPEKVENDRYVQLTKEQTAIYQKVIESMIPVIESTEKGNIKRAGMVFKLMTALKQICNHPSQFLKKKDYSPELSGKAEMMLNILQMIYENNEKVLIFTQYKEMGELLVKIIENRFGMKPLFLHGGVPRKKRDEMVNDFQDKNYIKTFILSIKAGGTGLNLTAANHVIHYDLWWNPAVESQATDRAFRIGQHKNVMVYRLITRGTFEEKINEMLQKKKELANLTVSSGEKWIGDLSNTEISELVKL